MPRRLVLFTSLPRVGGHSALTGGLCRLVRDHFDAVDIWCKPMPDHGHSTAMAAHLESLGCRITMLAGTAGHPHPPAMLGALARARAHRTETVFVALAMRHLSVLLSAALRPARSVYYHITHDLNPGTVRRLKFCARAFDHLAFICPATFHAFPGAASNSRFSWVPQSSQMPVANLPAILEARRRRRAANATPRFGLLGRLTPEKGALEIARFADSTRHPCEIHVAGTGPGENEFSRRAASPPAGKAARVVFHGAYDPANRADFLHDFFSAIDLLLVPSQDAWETLSMVALEGLQHGTPALLSNAGGLGSFGMPDLGPAPPEVIRLTPAPSFTEALGESAGRPLPDPDATAAACLKYYGDYFCDDRIRGRWLGMLGVR
jgi:glycosyltransferase involved in cell wall biosynthesis